MISGIHGLANFETMDSHGVITPFGSGCNLIVGIPLQEAKSENPKVVLGAFDPSVRIWFKREYLTITAPWSNFLQMVKNMDRSFLTTDN